MKKVVYAALSCLMTFSIAACSSNAPSNEASSSNVTGQEPIKLRIAWWGGTPRHEYTKKVIEMYEKQNPHVQIEEEYANYDDYWKKLAPQAAANQLPDIIQLDTSYFAQYANKGQLEELTSYTQNGTIDVSSITEDVVASGKLNDKLYGMSLGVNALTVVMDEEKLKKAGLQTPAPDWTWDDFEKLTIDVKNKTGAFGSNGLYPPDVFLPYYLRSHGQHMYSPDGTSLGYTDDSLFVEYFQRKLRLVEASAIPTPDLQAQLKGIEDDFIVKGTALMSWNWSNQYIGFTETAKRPLILHLPPGPNQKEGMFLKPSMFFSIANNSKHKEEAAKFISFFLNDIEANKLIKGDRGVPVSAKVLEGIKPVLSPEQTTVFEYVNEVSKNSSPLSPMDPPGSAEVIKTLKDISEQILFKRITPEEGAAKFRQKANEILAKNKG